MRHRCRPIRCAPKTPPRSSMRTSKAANSSAKAPKNAGAPPKARPVRPIATAPSSAATSQASGLPGLRRTAAQPVATR